MASSFYDDRQRIEMEYYRRAQMSDRQAQMSGLGGLFGQAQYAAPVKQDKQDEKLLLLEDL